MKADETGRVSVAFPERVIQGLITAKEKTSASFTGYINIAVAEKLKRDGYLKSERK